MHIWQSDIGASSLKVTLWEQLAEKVQHVKGKRGSKGQPEKIIVAIIEQQLCWARLGIEILTFKSIRDNYIIKKLKKTTHIPLSQLG